MPLERSYTKSTVKPSLQSTRAFIPTIALREDSPRLGGPGKKLNLRQVASNFNFIFPKSKYLNLKVNKPNVSGEKTLTLNIRADVVSSHGSKNYSSWIVLRRATLNDEFTSNSPAELRCSCPAFQYFAAYADWKKKTFAGRPGKWTTVKAPIRNPKTIPIPCKHLMALMLYMGKNKIIKH